MYNLDGAMLVMSIDNAIISVHSPEDNIALINLLKNSI